MSHLTRKQVEDAGKNGVLNLRGNNLKELPAEIGQLRNLRYLDIRENNFKELLA